MSSVMPLRMFMMTFTVRSAALHVAKTSVERWYSSLPTEKSFR